MHHHGPRATRGAAVKPAWAISPKSVRYAMQSPGLVATPSPAQRSRRSMMSTKSKVTFTEPTPRVEDGVQEEASKMSAADTVVTHSTAGGDICPLVLPPDKMEEKRAYEVRECGGVVHGAYVKLVAPLQWLMWNYPYKSWWAATRQALPVTIKTLSCGNSHTLMLSTDGEVWAFGGNHHGQVCDALLFPAFLLPHAIGNAHFMCK